MTLELRSYTPGDEQRWDDFCGTSYEGTLLHTRSYLSYHKDRFADKSLMIEFDGKLVGIFPAAVHHADATCVVSHPGVTYGGVVHSGYLRGSRMIETLTLIASRYAKEGFARLVYKVVPSFYHKAPAEDDVYALHRLGAALVRCDLSSSIKLNSRQPESQRRKRGLKKAMKAGFEVREGAQYLNDLWRVVTDNLQRKHGTKPVHSVEEIELLAGKFPSEIRCVVALFEEKVECGTLIFSTQAADHAQYIASSEVGYAFSGLDAVFEYAISSAITRGKDWFDFGISTEEGGAYLNDGLYNFKSEFGGGGTVHKFFELQLSGNSLWQ